jgi:hydrogenase nickel incorporation protein HypA/HybF
MREYDIAKKFLARALNASTEANHVKTIRVALGELAELSPSLIQTHWVELNKGTPLEHAQLNIRLVPAEAQCMACFQKYQPLDQKILCPYCGSYGAKILRGEECFIESIEAK